MKSFCYTYFWFARDTDGKPFYDKTNLQCFLTDNISEVPDEITRSRENLEPHNLDITYYENPFGADYYCLFREREPIHKYSQDDIVDALGMQGLNFEEGLKYHLQYYGLYGKRTTPIDPLTHEQKAFIIDACGSGDICSIRRKLSEVDTAKNLDRYTWPDIIEALKEIDTESRQEH